MTGWVAAADALAALLDAAERLAAGDEAAVPPEPTLALTTEPPPEALRRLDELLRRVADVTAAAESRLGELAGELEHLGATRTATRRYLSH